MVCAALSDRERLLEELGETVCPYCGVGCRLRFEGEPEQAPRVRGVETAAAFWSPANHGVWVIGR